MIKAIEKMSPGKRVALTLISIVIIFFCFSFIWDDLQDTKEQAFKKTMDDVLTLYDTAIDSYSVDIHSVYIHVNQSRWNNSSAETKAEFIKELGALTIANMEKCEIKKTTLYVFLGDKCINFFELKAK